MIKEENKNGFENAASDNRMLNRHNNMTQQCKKRQAKEEHLCL